MLKIGNFLKTFEVIIFRWRNEPPIPQSLKNLPTDFYLIWNIYSLLERLEISTIVIHACSTAHYEDRRLHGRLGLFEVPSASLRFRSVSLSPNPMLLFCGNYKQKVTLSQQQISVTPTIALCSYTDCNHIYWNHFFTDHFLSPLLFSCHRHNLSNNCKKRKIYL